MSVLPRIRSFLIFSGAGALSSVCIALSLSGRLGFISIEQAVFLSAFISSQALGLTIARFGIDQLIFAAASREVCVTFNYWRLWRWPILPLVCLFTVAIAFQGVQPEVWCGALLALHFDALSVARLSELVARREFLRCAVATLANNPLYFLLFFVLAMFLKLGVWSLVLLYCLTSLARFVVLFLTPRAGGMLQTELEVPLTLGLQQVLNYLLFKSDILLLGYYFALPVTADSRSQEDIRYALFLLRFPDLVSGFGALVANYSFSQVKTVESEGRLDLAGAIRPYLLHLGIYTMSLAGVFLIYLVIWSGPIHGAWWWALLVFLQGSLILPVNFITFLLFRKQDISGLVRSLFWGILLGILLVLLSFRSLSLDLIFCLVPAQLFCFLIVVAYHSPRSRWRRIASRGS